MPILAVGNNCSVRVRGHNAPRVRPHPNPSPTRGEGLVLPAPSRGRHDAIALPMRGFTLLELLLVLTIVALATAGVVLALPDNGARQLQREGERLAALLDAARANSRASGQVVRWRAAAAGQGQGFVFEGGSNADMPRHWLHGATHVRGPDAVLWLGPEPLIGAQQVVLLNPTWPQHAVRVATDGLRPFTVERME